MVILPDCGSGDPGSNPGGPPIIHSGDDYDRVCYNCYFMGPRLVFLGIVDDVLKFRLNSGLGRKEDVARGVVIIK